MSEAEIEKLKSVKDFDALVEYLRDVLDWPIEAEDAEDITFDYNPTELGIDKKHAAKIKTIKQIRPLTDNQPWGLFYIEFEPKKLPVVVLRRILKALVHSRRRRDDRMPTWDLSDLIFISSLVEMEERKISFAHFSESEQGLPELRAFSWDERDTYFHYLQNTLDLEKLRWPASENDSVTWREQWSAAFTLRHRYVPTTSKQLAIEMARLAAQIRDQVKSVYDYELASGPLHKLFESFKKMLIYDLEVDTFADMYAQTIAYGLFSAKATHEGEFAIEDISTMIPNTNPFLKNLFEECTRIGETQRDCLDLEELGVTELVKMLKEVNIEAILQDFGRQKKGEDPVIHFYEDFLREYDPKQKVKRGIFYTPDSVVSFIVRSVDYLLRTEFDCPDGLADTSTIPITSKNSKANGENVEEEKQVPKVLILDPAVGTGTFLKYVIEEIRKTFEENHKYLSDEELRKEWNEYVDKNLLPRVFGFELLMAPYAIAHLKLGLKLRETGYEFLSYRRLGVALTNALESGTASAETLKPHLGWLAQESKYSDHIKTSENVSVVVGNPPYSGHSANIHCDWIANLLRGKISDGARESNYFEVDGESLGERNPKWLNDDYVKFIRFGQWRIDKTGEGILAFITNHSYLDNPTFRGMRQQLMESFTDIYILDLHGNSKKKEKCPDGSKDENVFDIQQGVAIGIFVKNPQKTSPAKVHHADLWGLREEKYKRLFDNSIDTIQWEEVTPTSPFYFFYPQDVELKAEYESGWKITDIMPENSVGIVTARDHLTIQDSPEEVWEIVQDFSAMTEDIARSKYNLGEDAQDWKVSLAQNDLKESGLKKELIVPILYRPFDIKYTYYTGHSRGFICRPRSEVMWHMMHENLGLITVRQVAEGMFNHAYVADCITESRITLSNKGIAFLFPLYIYSDNTNETGCTLNLTSGFPKAIKEAIGTEPTPEAIFYYIYAVLYSPTYRKRYEGFLKYDFPRVPITSNMDLFKTVCRFGSELVSLHLMESPELDKLITEFKGEGDNVVAAIGKNSYKDGELSINKTQYFEGIPEEVYNFHIGGYQVCQKWLKDRKGRELSEEEIEHYQKIVVVLNETIRIMKEIDEVIEGHGGWPAR
ncbi:MAG TPA: DNA methyltransferase [Methanophagales archaeon]|nr:DNA methyltransferase [Methanophagales archaeon]